MDSSPVSVRTQIALLLREVEVGQNSGTGSLTWAVIEPIIGICLLSVIFMIAFPAPPLGGQFRIVLRDGAFAPHSLSGRDPETGRRTPLFPPSDGFHQDWNR